MENKFDFAFDYIWSSRPLLSAQQGDEIILDKEVTEMLVNWSSDPNFGVQSGRINWPVENWNQDKTDWSIVQDRNANVAAKLFTNRLTQGRAAIHRKRINESLILHFDTDKIPYLGLWLFYEGWPENWDEKNFTIALEPTNAQTDSLSEAIKRSEAIKIKSCNIQRWAIQYSGKEGRTIF